MPFTVTMPKLSPTMVEGNIAKWHKKVGEYVESGDLLLEISTDKATIEYNALDAGWLRKTLKQEGQKAQVNEPLAVFTEEKTESIEGYEPEGIVPSPKAQVSSAPKAAPKAQTKPAAPKPVASAAVQVATTPRAPAPKAVAVAQKHERPAERVMASPLAKTLARQQGIDLSGVKGSGPHGRIISRDLDNVQLEAAQSDYQEEALSSEQVISHEVEEHPLSPMRRVIGERLQYSKSNIPHFYLRQEVNVEQLVAFREETKKLDRNFTVNDFIIKAVAIALRKHPNVNCGFNPDTQSIIRYPTVDLAIAVTIPGGLITPIVKHADTKPLSKLSQEVKLLASKAKDGKLQPHEYQGGSFTISNLGMFGITDFQAIINPPQAGILAIGTVQDKPVVKNGAVVPGKILNITLSCDHRAIDGAEAAQFMQTLKNLIENPILFLSE